VWSGSRPRAAYVSFILDRLSPFAVNKDGVIRGNYYDGLTDATTEVYGSVDKKVQRAAWMISKKKDRVFEAGVYNLTRPQCPCLAHVGTQTTDQMMLVRFEQPKTQDVRAVPIMV
jgi:hypothetical protein